MLHSPVSTWHDALWTDVLSVLVCACGEVRKVKVGEKNGRLRRDDLRAGKYG